MNGYGVPTAAGAGFLLAVVAAALGLGLLAARSRGVVTRALGWALLLAVAVVGPLATSAERGGTRMLLLCTAVLLAMKALVTAEARAEGRAVPTGRRWLAFALLWPGMRPWAFVPSRRAPRRRAASDAWGGLFGMAAGAGLIVLARALARDALVPAAALLVVGLGLCLHFGLFRLLAGLWRRKGLAVQPPFDAPWRARSLTEFWSRRWNVAFSEMLHVTVRRPLLARVGPRAATFASFLVSGLLHELALSVPGRGGYGLPTVYFVLHGALVLLEPSLRWGDDAAGERRRRAWTLAWVLVPALLVLHPPAWRAIVLPLLEA